MESHDQKKRCGPAKPEWIRSRLSGSGDSARVRAILNRHGLNTVCEGARCPNMGECWARGTATFMILGSLCTRDCRFCDVKTGRPAAPDPTEPDRAAEAVTAMKLKYVVLTSVTRDDLSDGGAEHWARTITTVREKNPETRIEVLIPDLRGDEQALNTILSARPDVLGHNLETVPRLYPLVRPGSEYQRSLTLLERAASKGFLVKTGIMAGLGETREEILALFMDARQAGVSVITAGQYLQPSRSHHPVERYLAPDEFTELEARARETGFTKAFCGPFVRSSYLAETVFTGDIQG